MHFALNEAKLSSGSYRTRSLEMRINHNAGIHKDRHRGSDNESREGTQGISAMSWYEAATLRIWASPAAAADEPHCSHLETPLV